MSDDSPLLASLRRYDPQLTDGAIDQWLDTAAEPAVEAWVATWPPDQRELVALLLQERRQRARGDADLEQVVDRLSRVARDMAANAVECLKAGLAGDARRWRAVRSQVVTSLERLGAPEDAVGLGWPTITVEITPDDLAAEMVHVPEGLLADASSLQVSQSVWVSDGAGRRWEGMVRRSRHDGVWPIRLFLGRSYDATYDVAVDEQELLDDLIAVEYEARGAVLDDRDRDFIARTSRRAWDRIRQLEQQAARHRDADPGPEA